MGRARRRLSRGPEASEAPKARPGRSRSGAVSSGRASDACDLRSRCHPRRTWRCGSWTENRAARWTVLSRRRATWFAIRSFRSGTGPTGSPSWSEPLPTWPVPRIRRSSPIGSRWIRSRAQSVAGAARIRFGLPRAARGASRSLTCSASASQSRWTTSLLAPGYHTVVWDGNGSGRGRLSSGIYLVRLVVDGQAITRRLALVK